MLAPNIRTIRLFLLLGLLLGTTACAASLTDKHGPAPTVTPLQLRQAADPATSSPLPTTPQPTQTRLQRGTSQASSRQPAQRPSNPTTTPDLPADARSYEPLDPDLQPPPAAMPVPLLAADRDIVLYALLGNDVQGKKGGRTDSIVLAALNRKAQTITLLSIPRDLYVVIPGWTTGRINLAYAHGGAEGSDLFKETMTDNLGVPVTHTVRVGFEGFKQIIDALGGIEVVVNCPVRDWRLKSPELDPAVEENWEQFELGYGVQQMDGELALWYARSRRSSSDFDRGRRQQKILRALWQKARNASGMAAALPVIVDSLWTAVDTDLALDEALLLAAEVPKVGAYTVQSLMLPPQALQAWTVPDSGEAVQRLVWAAARETLQALVAPPALRTAEGAKMRVAIQSDDFILYRQAAENLAWYGFEAVYEPASEAAVNKTTITYYGPSFKGAFVDRLAWIFRQVPEDVQHQPWPIDETVDYRVLLAPDYNPCLDYLGEPPAR